MRLFLIFLLLSTQYVGLCQTKLTEDEAVNLVVKNHPLASASSLAVTKSKQLQKTAYNISNPEIMMESPSGEFQTVGVLQSFNFPTVYMQQHQLLKQQTQLSEVNKKVTLNDLKYQVRSIYLSVQYYEFLLKQYVIQDSIFTQIQKSAQRQYEAGQIDYLEKTYVDAQYGEVHNQYQQAEIDLKAAIMQLKNYLNMKEDIQLNPLAKNELPLASTTIKSDTSVVQANPSLLSFKQQLVIDRKSLSLEKNKFLPGFTIGYLNQGAKNTPSDLRIRAGINIPLWFWQYTGNISAAKTEVKISEQKVAAHQLALTTEMLKAQGDLIKYSQSLNYYETTGLKQSNDIISTSKRFFEGGHEFDYIAYLRNINDAYVIKIRYAEVLKNFNQSVINLNYLTGNL